jgi:hypothetical protein
MKMRRTWVVYDVFLGTPVLVERCPTQAAALRVAELRKGRCGVALHIAEQVLPDLDAGELATARLASDATSGGGA